MLLTEMGTSEGFVGSDVKDEDGMPVGYVAAVRGTEKGLEVEVQLTDDSLLERLTGAIP